MYANWATITLDEPQSPLVVTPFNRLPSEVRGESDAEILRERRRIKDEIVNRPNFELEHDKRAMSLLQTLGSDLMINAFACNFRIGSDINRDVVEASFLNQRLYRRLSVTKLEDNLEERPIIIMGTEFSVKRYGDTLERFKKRVGLEGDEDLFALSNTSMSPWPTAGNFLRTIVDEFKRIAEEEIKARLRIKLLRHRC